MTPTPEDTATFEAFRRRLVRFDAFSRWVERSPRMVSAKADAVYLFNAFGCAEWDDETFLRLLLTR